LRTIEPFAWAGLGAVISTILTLSLFIWAEQIHKSRQKSENQKCDHSVDAMTISEIRDFCFRAEEIIYDPPIC